MGREATHSRRTVAAALQIEQELDQLVQLAEYDHTLRSTQSVAHARKGVKRHLNAIVRRAAELLHPRKRRHSVEHLLVCAAHRQCERDNV